MDQLTLIRFYSDAKSTLGMLVLNGAFLAFTIEDTYHEKKVPGETRIPAGTYPLRTRLSPKFTPRYGHLMIEIDEVPGFDYTYFHPGANALQTLGCVLVGDAVVRSTNSEGQGSYILGGYSLPCYLRVYKELRKRMDAGSLTHVTILDQMPNLSPTSQIPA